MKKKLIVATVSFIAVIGAVVICYILKWNSKVNVNTRLLEEQLRYTQSDGKVSDLLDFDYDKVYVFEPYAPKESMERTIGFKCSILQETVSESMMNMLFLKDDTPVAYLYGYASYNGYYIKLATGSYTKLELDHMNYQVTQEMIGNDDVYMYYVFTK